MVEGRKSIVDRILKDGDGDPLINVGMAVVGLAADDYIESSVALIRNNDEYEFASNRIKMLREEIADIRKELKAAKKAHKQSAVCHKMKSVRDKAKYLTNDTELHDMLRVAHGKLIGIHKKNERILAKARLEFKKIAAMEEEIRQLTPTDREYHKHLNMMEECKEFFESGNASLYVYDFDSTGIIARLDEKVKRIIMG